MSDMRAIDIKELKELLARYFVGPRAPMFFSNGIERGAACRQFLSELADLVVTPPPSS